MITVSKKALRPLFLALICLSLLAGVFLPPAQAAETVSKAVPARETGFTYDLFVTENEPYAGIEFGLTLSDEAALKFVAFTPGADIGGASAGPFVEARGTHYFGFFTNSNAFSGEKKVGTLHFTYTGDSEQTIALTEMQIARIGADGTSAFTARPSPVLVITVNRIPSSGPQVTPPQNNPGNQQGNQTVTVEEERDLPPLPPPPTVTITTSQYFDDVDEHWSWAVNEIDALYEGDVVKGTAPRRFNPGAHITRGDFILMLARAFDLTAEGGVNFPDVPPGSYYYDAIAVAKALGIARGDGVNFRPNAFITRQDIMVLLDRTLQVIHKPLPAGAPSELDPFSDRDRISVYAQDAVATLVRSGIVKGSGSEINPLGLATRAETAVIIYRALTLDVI